MEVVYFVISAIEIILTVFLVFTLRKWNKGVLDINNAIVNNTDMLNKNVKVTAKVLNVTSKVSFAYKKFEMLNEILSKVKPVLAVLAFLQGKRSSKKFSIVPILRKILFFI